MLKVQKVKRKYSSKTLWWTFLVRLFKRFCCSYDQIWSTRLAVMCNMSHVTCHMYHVMCHMSWVTCYVSLKKRLWGSLKGTCQNWASGMLPPKLGHIPACVAFPNFFSAKKNITKVESLFENTMENYFFLFTFLHIFRLTTSQSQKLILKSNLKLKSSYFDPKNLVEEFCSIF